MPSIIILPYNYQESVSTCLKKYDGTVDGLVLMNKIIIKRSDHHDFLDKIRMAKFFCASSCILPDVFRVSSTNRSFHSNHNLATDDHIHFFLARYDLQHLPRVNFTVQNALPFDWEHTGKYCKYPNISIIFFIEAIFKNPFVGNARNLHKEVQCNGIEWYPNSWELKPN